MRRDKAWWARLTEDERREVVRSEAGWALFDCPTCSAQGYVLCDSCKTNLKALLAKANGGQDAERTKP